MWHYYMGLAVFVCVHIGVQKEGMFPNLHCGQPEDSEKKKGIDYRKGLELASQLEEARYLEKIHEQVGEKK